MKLHISEDYIVSVAYFIQNYFEITYTKKEKLTHDEMKEFLLEKIGKGARRISIASISKEDVFTGKVLLVKDKEGKVIPYRNPKGNLSMLEEELKSNYSLEELQRIRENILQNEENCPNQKSYQKGKRREQNGKF